MNQKRPRVITGKYKNKKLEVPEGTRPVTDRVKMSIFDSLSEIIEGSTFLDLFAGSGSIGIEALSRGSKHATFVESNQSANLIIKQNLTSVGAQSDEYRLLKLTYQFFVREYTGKYDIIFLDPPFKGIPKIDLTELSKFMTEDSVLVFKIQTGQESEINFPQDFNIIHKDRIGTNTIYYIRLKEITNPNI